jgi:hypothetical protein
MSSTISSQRNSAFATLRRFARSRAAVERCELCSLELAAQHQHLIELANRKLVCACDACAILFANTSGGKYKRVPRRSLSLPKFRLSDAQWENLLIPINMAFFFHNTQTDKVAAFYPSPAGATESLLMLEAWEEIVGENPILKTMESDVEALLVKRVSRIGEQGDQTNAEYYIVPIDECYKLVGLIRTHWRGLSGGTTVWEEIKQFFADLQERSRIIRETSNA